MLRRRRYFLLFRKINEIILISAIKAPEIINGTPKIEKFAIVLNLLNAGCPSLSTGKTNVKDSLFVSISCTCT